MAAIQHNGLTLSRSGPGGNLRTVVNKAALSSESSLIVSILWFIRDGPFIE